MISDNSANIFVEDMKSSFSTRSTFHIPSYFYSRSFGYMYNSSYNYYCKGFHKDYISFAFLNNNLTDFNEFSYIRLYDDGNSENVTINLYLINDMSLRTQVYNYVRTYCTEPYYSSGFVSTNSVSFNNNIYDDLIYSKEPSEYIIGMLYFAIPILLFIVGLKVFKKGLFR